MEKRVSGNANTSEECQISPPLPTWPTQRLSCPSAPRWAPPASYVPLLLLRLVNTYLSRPPTLTAARLERPLPWVLSGSAHIR